MSKKEVWIQFVARFALTMAIWLFLIAPPTAAVFLYQLVVKRSF